jgi:nucleotide-binding universal stress UspA family protein
MTIRSLLVATDFSEHARRAALRAALLAREHRARRVTLLHVAPGQPALARALRRRLQDLARELKARTGVTLAPRLAQGSVVDVIARAAGRFDLLVVGARGMHPLRDLAIGTSAERLVRKVRRPLLVVKRAPAGSYRRVLAPVDFSADAAAALGFAARLAPAASLAVLHAYEAPYESKLRFAGLAEDTIHERRRQARAQALAAMDRMLLALRLTGARVSRHVTHGYAPSVISRADGELGADLVAIGKHGRSLLADLLLGSVTQHALASAKGDVLVVPSTRRAARARR